jgi:hypothetical protein
MAPGGMNLYGEFAPNVSLDRQCPHCGGISQVVPKAELQYVCSICGGPRVPFAEGIAPSAGTVAALRRAETARKSRTAMRALSLAGALGGAFAASLLVMAAFVGSMGWALAFGAAFGLPALVMFVVGSGRSKEQTKEMKRLLDEAWANAAGDAYAAGKAGTTAALAQALNVSTARAEELQAVRTVDASLEPAEGAPRANVPHDPRFDALEQKVRIASDSTAEAQKEAQAEAEAEAAREGSPSLKAKS